MQVETGRPLCQAWDCSSRGLGYAEASCSLFGVKDFSRVHSTHGGRPVVWKSCWKYLECKLAGVSRKQAIRSRISVRLMESSDWHQPRPANKAVVPAFASVRRSCPDPLVFAPKLLMRPVWGWCPSLLSLGGPLHSQAIPLDS